MFRATWKDFRSRFQHILDNLRRHRILIESRANSTDIQEARILRAKTQDFFQKNEESELKSKVFAVLSWLSSADAYLDQEAFEEIRREYPEAGRWIFDHRMIKTWRDPDSSAVPMVWLNGIPGAGMAPCQFEMMDASDGSLWSPDENRQDYIILSYHRKLVGRE